MTARRRRVIPSRAVQVRKVAEARLASPAVAKLANRARRKSSYIQIGKESTYGTPVKPGLRIDVESIIRKDLAEAHAAAIDRAWILGSPTYPRLIALLRGFIEVRCFQCSTPLGLAKRTALADLTRKGDSR